MCYVLESATRFVGFIFLYNIKEERALYDEISKVRAQVRHVSSKSKKSFGQHFMKFIIVFATKSKILGRIRNKFLK